MSVSYREWYFQLWDTQRKISIDDDSAKLIVLTADAPTAPRFTVTQTAPLCRMQFAPRVPSSTARCASGPIRVSRAWTSR